MKLHWAVSLGVAVVVVAVLVPFVTGEQKRSNDRAPTVAPRTPTSNPLVSRKAADALEPDPRAKAELIRPISKRSGDSQVTASAQDARGIPDIACDDCGPGDHWIDDPLCAGGLDRFSTTALVGLDTSLNCELDTSLVLFDATPVTILRSDPLEVSVNFPTVGTVDSHLDVIDTKIDFMLLTNANASVFLAAGRAATITLSPSLGAIMEQSGNAALADSFFDVNFEIEFGDSFLYSQEPLRVETVINCVSPKALYLHITGCHGLYTSPIPGEGVLMANLVSAQHETFPDPCPDLGDCCTVHQGSGCIEGSCCQTVCGADSSCCDGTTFAWNQSCAELAWQLCPATCAPLGSNYSFSPGVRPTGATDCQPVFDARILGELDDIIIFDGFGEPIRTLINGAVPNVFENKFSLPDDVTLICFSMSDFSVGEIFPLPADGGPTSGDGCLTLGGDAPLDLPPEQSVVGASLFATDSNGDIALDTLLDSSVCTITNDAMRCNVDLLGLAGVNVDSVSLCVDLAESAPEICEATGDAIFCTSCSGDTSIFCTPTCVSPKTAPFLPIVTTCDCVEEGGCRVIDPGLAEPMNFCGGTCPPCETCNSSGGPEDQMCCGCGRTGDINGDGSIDMKDFRRFQASFGQDGVAGTVHDCADINGDGKVTLCDYFLLQTEFTDPLPPLDP